MFDIFKIFFFKDIDPVLKKSLIDLELTYLSMEAGQYILEFESQLVGASCPNPKVETAILDFSLA